MDEGLTVIGIKWLGLVMILYLRFVSDQKLQGIKQAIDYSIERLL